MHIFKSIQFKKKKKGNKIEKKNAIHLMECKLN
jgi:hypothetical protein